MLADFGAYNAVLLEFGLIFLIVVLVIGMFLARKMAQTSVIVGIIAGIGVLIGAYFMINLIFGVDLLHAKVEASPATYALMIGAMFALLLAYAFAGPTPLTKSMHHTFFGGPFSITVLAVMSGVVLWTGLDSIFSLGGINFDLTQVSAGPLVGNFGSLTPTEFAHAVAVAITLDIWLLLLNRWGARQPEFNKTPALLKQLNEPAFKMRAALSHPTVGPTNPSVAIGPIRPVLPPEYVSVPVPTTQPPLSYPQVVAPSVAQPMANAGPWKYALPFQSRFWKLDRVLATIGQDAVREDVMLSVKVRQRGHYGSQLLHVTENHLFLQAPKEVTDIPRTMVRGIDNSGLGTFPINIRLSTGDVFELGALGPADYNPNPSYGLLGGFGRGKAADQDDLTFSLQSLFGFLTPQQDTVQRPNPSF